MEGGDSQDTQRGGERGIQNLLSNPGWQDVVSLNEVSMNIITGIISPVGLKTLGKIIPDSCVQTLGGGGGG